MISFTFFLERRYTKLPQACQLKAQVSTLERAEYFELKAKTKPCLDVMTMSNAMKVATTFLRRGHEKQLLD